MFILDAAYQFLQDILQGNKACDFSFFVEHHGLMEFPCLKASNPGIGFFISSNKGGRSHDLPQRNRFFAIKKPHDILSVHKAHYFKIITLLYGKS